MICKGKESTIFGLGCKLVIDFPPTYLSFLSSHFISTINKLRYHPVQNLSWKKTLEKVAIFVGVWGLGIVTNVYRNSVV